MVDLSKINGRLDGLRLPARVLGLCGPESAAEDEIVSVDVGATQIGYVRVGDVVAVLGEIEAISDDPDLDQFVSAIRVHSVDPATAARIRRAIEMRDLLVEQVRRLATGNPPIIDPDVVESLANTFRRVPAPEPAKATARVD